MGSILAGQTASGSAFGPVTMGIRRTIMLLPLNIIEGLPEAHPRTVTAQECAQWTYKPFLLDGDPVAADTPINVVCSLKK